MTGMRKKRTNFMVVLGVLLAVDVGLVTYLLWPGANLHAEDQQLHQQFQVMQRQVEPLIGIDKKLEDTRARLKTFYDQRVLGQWSQISNEVYKLAQENGVSLQAIKYKPDESGLPNLQSVTIDTGISGDYLKIVHFINALERAKPLFVINLVALRGQTGGAVELQISFQTFLKETT